MRAALVAGDRVDLVDDHRAQLAERRAPAHGRQQDEQRLRRGDQDVRRLASPSSRARRPACRRCAPRRGSRGTSRRSRAARAASSRERRLEVALDVVRQRLERRDVEDRRVVRQRRLEAAPHELVEAREERGERLAASRSAPRSARLRPRAIRGQPSRCGAVGAPKRSRNHPRDERMECVEHVAARRRAYRSRRETERMTRGSISAAAANRAAASQPACVQIARPAGIAVGERARTLIDAAVRADPAAEVRAVVTVGRHGRCSLREHRPLAVDVDASAVICRRTCTRRASSCRGVADRIAG